MVEHLQAGLGQAFEIAGIERRGLGGVLAHDNGGLKMEGTDQHVLDVVADHLCDDGGRQEAMKSVFEVVIIVADCLGDQIAGGTAVHPCRNLNHAGPCVPRRVKVKRLSIALVIGLLCAPTAAFSDPQETQRLNATIKKCVQALRSAGWEYDAFYNPATGQIEQLGNPQSHFMFRKCMAYEGSPLRD